MVFAGILWSAPLKVWLGGGWGSCPKGGSESPLGLLVHLAVAKNMLDGRPENLRARFGLLCSPEQMILGMPAHVRPRNFCKASTARSFCSDDECRYSSVVAGDT